MKPTQKSVLLGLSGGVDSAVAALILKKQGYKVTGTFMRCFSENKNILTGSCNWREDLKDAEYIALKLDIPLIVLNYEKEYMNQVIKPMFKKYASGITPNPDTDCNTIIKFPFLLKEAKKRGIKYIATGHYVQKVKKNNNFFLKIPKDKTKDQSYFLYGLSQKDISKAIFPIGDYTKKEVREIAKKNKFQNWDKKGSSGVCFVGPNNFKHFLKQKIKEKPGIIKNSEGEKIGTHIGAPFYTIGERIGEAKKAILTKKINEKLYVVSKNEKTNDLIVAPKNNQGLYKKEFKINRTNWITETRKFPLKNIFVRIRHLGELHKSTIEKVSNKLKVILKKPVFGVAPGQATTIYTKEGLMLGGGIIS